MGKEFEPLNQFDDADIEVIGQSLNQAISQKETSFVLERRNHSDYDPYSEDHLVPQFYWILTAKLPENDLEINMIVRGQSWTQVEELWFSKEKKNYFCGTDMINRVESLKELRQSFRQKAAEIHDRELSVNEEKDRKHKETIERFRHIEAILLASSIKGR